MGCGCGKVKRAVQGAAKLVQSAAGVGIAENAVIERRQAICRPASTPFLPIEPALFKNHVIGRTDAAEGILPDATSVPPAFENARQRHAS